MNTISKITHILQRDNGSQIKIVAQACFGSGLHMSIDSYFLHRKNSNSQWRLLSKNKHPNANKMSRSEYLEKGRPEFLQYLSHGEILKVTSLIGQPIGSEYILNT